VADVRSSLWLLEGFRPPALFEQIFGSRDPFGNNSR
jgi:hypothetical protein